MEDKPIEYFIELLRRRIPFTFNRFGDGEWASILGERGKNCDGAVYSPDLRAALLTVLQDAPVAQKRCEHYYYGMLIIARKVYGQALLDRFMEDNGIQVNWIEGTIFVQANRNGNLNDFIKILQSRDMMYVGPKHLRKLGNLFTMRDFVQVDSTRAFDSWESTVQKVLNRSQASDLIGVSAGPGAKVIVHALNYHLWRTHTIIDFGSLWDGYVGVGSRKYMRRETWLPTMLRNLGG